MFLDTGIQNLFQKIFFNSEIPFILLSCLWKIPFEFPFQKVFHYLTQFYETSTSSKLENTALESYEQLKVLI